MSMRKWKVESQPGRPLRGSGDVVPMATIERAQMEQVAAEFSKLAGLVDLTAAKIGELLRRAVGKLSCGRTADDLASSMVREQERMQQTLFAFQMNRHIISKREPGEFRVRIRPGSIKRKNIQPEQQRDLT